MTGRTARRRWLPLAGAMLLVLGTIPAIDAAAQVDIGDSSGGGTYALEDGERSLKFAGVPIPNYSEILGLSLGVVGMAYYKLDRHDDLCPPSSSGLFGFYSSNHSWLGAMSWSVLVGPGQAGT